MYDSDGWWSTAALPVTVSCCTLAHLCTHSCELEVGYFLGTDRKAQRGRGGAALSGKLHVRLEAQLEGAMGAAATAAETLSGHTRFAKGTE